MSVSLAACLAAPERVVSLSLRDWDSLVRIARDAGLLGRLAWLLERDGVIDHVPDAPRAHLRWARALSEACAREVRYEVTEIARALARTGTQAVLLKGAAYGAAGHDAAAGRFYRDIDILVAESDLPDAESALTLHGWWPEALSAYDRHYYRRWMHEIPPLRHVRRGTVVDVHFNILPRLGQLRPDPRRLLDAAVRPAGAAMPVLALPDLILHSSAHLFQNGEFDRGLRDLSDLDLLLREWARTAPDHPWERLVGRAGEMDLAGPLHLALVLTHSLLATPVPAEAAEAAGRQAHPGAIGRRLLAGGFARAVRPSHRLSRTVDASVARWLLYVRSHWIRLPAWLLIPHLTRKWFVRRTEGATR